MGLADLLLPVPAFDGSASSPLQQPESTSVVNGRSSIKVSKRKRIPESNTVRGAKEKEAEQDVKVVERSAKKVKSAKRSVAGHSNTLGQGHDEGDQPSTKDGYGVLYAELETRAKKGKGSGKRRGNEEVEQGRKVARELVKNGKRTTVDKLHVAAASNGPSQGLFGGEARKARENEALPADAERRARKNAKRKQRREKALGLRGNLTEAPGKVKAGKDALFDAPLGSKRSKKRESPSLPRSDTGQTAETAAHSKENGGSTLVQGPPHVEKAQALRKPKPATFLEKMQARLWGGKFRMLNETLYTCNGEDAFALFKQDPSAFEIYHAGYQEQMSRWPKLPVEAIADWLRAHSADLVVADFGCGDGRLAEMVENRVFSMDLVASKPSVIACNMAHTPLDASSVDVTVFCLSLMGTDYPSYLKEAHRVLKPSGWLLIAEVRSRFDPNNGGADPNDFAQALKSLGFSSELEDSSNKMFILLYFRKQAGKAPRNRKAMWPELKPCAYKRR